MRSPPNDEGSGPLSGSEKAVEFVKKIKWVLPAAATKRSRHPLRFTERFTDDAFDIVENGLILCLAPGGAFAEELEEFASKERVPVVSNREALRGAPEKWPPSTETLCSPNLASQKTNQSNSPQKRL